ncbi:MAG: glycine betaine ABC transporter substrate-binding protein [Eubacteriales bacterium]|nr:glycine betaine ABC transporter substrate-binding protein [Eubacteriales bacterium]
MIQGMWELFLSRKSFFLELLLEHLQISTTAIVIAIIIGGIAGLLISEYQKAAKPTLAVINFLYTIPSISMLGFLIPFSGVGNATAIIALTVYALLPMVRNMHTGLTNVDDAILEAAKGMGSTRIQILFKIKLPLAMPVVFSGIRSMVTMTIALAGIASFIGAGGLGVAIYRGITMNNMAMTMVGSLLIALLALVIDAIMGVVENTLKKRVRIGKKARIGIGIVVAAIIISLLGNMILSTQKKDTIHIATKPMTEQYIIGDMLQLLIEQDTDLEVEMTQGINGAIIAPGMESGEFDLYPEYTGTGWNMILLRDGLYQDDMFDELNQGYQEELNQQWVGMYGFSDMFGIGVRKEIAEKYNLETYSDLIAVADQLTFGAEYDFFEREDGYDALCAVYGFEFGKTMDLDIGLKYQAINQGKIDLMTIFTTDGQLTDSDLVVLEDDLQFFPADMCGNVIRTEVLEAHPELYTVFDKLTGVLTNDEMANMNYQVESEGKDAKELAREFLAEKGLLNE